MRLTVVGTGYVGLVSGTCLANTGNAVVCLDIDPKKIALLRGGTSPIYEPGLDELIEQNVRAGRLSFTTDKGAAYAQAEAIFICVGTPSDDAGRADLKYVLAVADDIGAALDAGVASAADPDGPAHPGGPVVIVKSTVPVGTNAQVAARIRARTGRPFRMASNPEFLKEGDAITDFNKPDRIVIGSGDDATAQQLTDLYAPYVRQGNPILVMDIPSAEMVKYASNAMLATKISFINEIANLCEAYGADVDEVRRGMCADRRIGNQFLYPGLGYGGSCFPKDVLAVISMGADRDVPTLLMRSVDDVNRRQRASFLRKIVSVFGEDLRGRRFAVWGLAFKPGTDDVREAPAITLVESLAQRGADVVAYDPVARETARELLHDGAARFVDSAMAAVDGADALVVATEWNEFRHPDFVAIKKRMRMPIVFDGRNIFRPATLADLGFVYHSVGRAAVGAR